MLDQGLTVFIGMVVMVDTVEAMNHHQVNPCTE